MFIMNKSFNPPEGVGDIPTTGYCVPMQTYPASCPNCGRCPTCGKSGYYPTYPYPYPYWYYQIQPQTTFTS